MKMKDFMLDSSRLKVLELFAGSRSIGKAADKLGMETFSVDWTEYENIDLAIDIAEMKIEDCPFIPDVVWASPDCTTYSIAAISTHRNKQEPKSEYAKQCDKTNKHFISLISIAITNLQGEVRKLERKERKEVMRDRYCQRNYVQKY